MACRLVDSAFRRGGLDRDDHARALVWRPALTAELAASAIFEAGTFPGAPTFQYGSRKAIGTTQVCHAQLGADISGDCDYRGRLRIRRRRGDGVEHRANPVRRISGAVPCESNCGYRARPAPDRVNGTLVRRQKRTAANERSE